MKCHVNFKHLDHSSSIEDYVQEKMTKLERFEWKPGSAHLTLSRHNKIVQAELSLTVADATFHSSVEADDFTDAIDLAIEKLGRQLVRKKKKIQSRKRPTNRDSF